MKLGTHVIYSNDAFDNEKQIFFYPNISANYAVLEGKVELYMSLKGGMEKNLLRDLVQENPYAQSQLAVFHQDKKWEANLGVKSKIGKRAFANVNFSKGKVTRVISPSNSFFVF